MIDIQYFDIRISLAFWILLAGMRSIIRENNINKKMFNNFFYNFYLNLKIITLKSRIFLKLKDKRSKV